MILAAAKYKILSILLLNLVLLTIALLIPFNFDFKKNNASWLKTKNGIGFKQKGQIISEGSTDALYEMLTKGIGLSLEVWVKPYNIRQNGPARILSYSIDPYLRNFTLAQSKDKLVMRLRTDKTDLNGVRPHVEVSNIFEANKIMHLIVTYDYWRECIYLNGKMRKCDYSLKGNFSNWDSSFKLVIGNEATGDRPWFGEIFYVAIYNMALNGMEVRKKYEMGFSKMECNNKSTISRSLEAAVCYLFNEKKGIKVADRSDSSLKLNLDIPNKLPTVGTILNTYLIKNLKNSIIPTDILLNIIGFTPLGFLLHRLIKFQYRQYFNTILTVLLIGLFLSLGFEILQHYLPTRHSSIIDIFTNMIGLILGITIDKFIY